MVAQTSYKVNHDIAYDGLFADINPKAVITKIASGDNAIDFGRVVSRGSNDDQCLLGGDGNPLGIAGRDIGRETLASGAINYEAGDDCAILIQGFMYVTVYDSSGASPGDPLYYANDDGKISAGVPGVDDTPLNGTLEESLTSNTQIALIHIGSSVASSYPEGSVVYKGAIAAAADFPTSAEVMPGWSYAISADVTDNDPTKTNTGQSFVAGDEIIWNGAQWTLLGRVLMNITDQQVTAATANSVGFIATEDGQIETIYAAALTGAGAGESMSIDVKIGGTTCLVTPITVNQASGTSVVAAAVDPLASAFSKGDLVTVERTYTAGGTPAPMTDTAVTIGFRG